MHITEKLYRPSWARISPEHEQIRLEENKYCVGCKYFRMSVELDSCNHPRNGRIHWFRKPSIINTGVCPFMCVTGL